MSNLTLKEIYDHRTMGELDDGCPLRIWVHCLSDDGAEYKGWYYYHPTDISSTGKQYYFHQVLHFWVYPIHHNLYQAFPYLNIFK